MSDVVASYEAATAPLTPQNIVRIRDAVRQRVELLDELGAEGQITAALEAAAEAQTSDEPGEVLTAENVQSARQHLLIFGDGFLRAVRACNGWGPTAIPDRAANGYVLLVAGFDEVGFDPVVWGGFWNCKYRVDDQLIELTGRAPNSYGLFSVYIGEGVPFDEITETVSVYRFDLRALISETLVDVAFDVRFDPLAGLVETRVFVDDGYVIPAATLDLTGVRASNGDFVCTVDPLSCTSGTVTISP